MSCYVVSREHIDHIVTGLIRAELVAMTPDEIGRMLWRENLISVACRYPDDEDGERPGPVDFRDSDVLTYTYTERTELDAKTLKTTLASYRYQSCEHRGWDGSDAQVVTAKLEAGLGDVQKGPDGWDW